MIYIHVPFCRSFCTYCDFYSELACKGKDATAIQGWADGICAEIEARRAEIESTLDLDTLYIGGGTPSVLPLSVLRRILYALDVIREGQKARLCPIKGTQYGHCPSEKLPPQSGFVHLSPWHAGEYHPFRAYQEFTIEVNPEDIVERGPEYVRGLLDLGVTRISMGVQSLDDGILKWMNRRHSADGARRAYQVVRDCIAAVEMTGLEHGEISSQDLRHPRLRGRGPSFSMGGAKRSAAVGEEILPCEVSVDLITGVPGMTQEILASTLEEVISWHPEHISAYQLSIEEGSTLAKMIEDGKVSELDENECRAQYELVCRSLVASGYHHYEISNWAIPGHEAIHNSAYWTRHPYVGLGPGAHSFLLLKGATAYGRTMPGPGSLCGTLPDPLSVAEDKNIIQRRSWNSQVPYGWTADYEDLTPEQIHTEEVMLTARTDHGPIPECDWFIADEIIPNLL